MDPKILNIGKERARVEASRSICARFEKPCCYCG